MNDRKGMVMTEQEKDHKRTDLRIALAEGLHRYWFQRFIQSWVGILLLEIIIMTGYLIAGHGRVDWKTDGVKIVLLLVAFWILLPSVIVLQHRWLARYRQLLISLRALIKGLEDEWKEWDWFDERIFRAEEDRLKIALMYPLERWADAKTSEIRRARAA